MAPLLGLALFVGVFVSISAPAVQAATTSSNLNFQARLLNNLGGIVPDGTYNIDFKIYNADSTTGSVGTCAGACVWEETRTNAGGHGVQVINGYFSVNLGSVTPFGPSINWDQQLWLTMNIGGTAAGAVTWDGEMQNSGHSIALTALPYAFTAGQLAKTSGSNRGVLSFNTVANNPVITLPDETGTVCTTAATGICTQAGTGFVQLQSATPGTAQTGNFNINGTGVATILQAGTLDTATGVALGIGTTNATAIDLNKNTVLAAGKTLTITGDTTTNRPSASGNKGMLYFDTDTGQLLQSNGSKWVSDRSTATKIVAPSAWTSATAAQLKAEQDSADYVATGTDDGATINLALSALPATGGGIVYLLPGTYTLGTTAISVPDNTTLAGSGSATLLTFANNIGSSTYYAITNSDTTTGTHVNIQNLMIDGNKSNNAAATEMDGIYFNGMGSGSGSSAIDGAKLTNVVIKNIKNYGIYTLSSSNNTIIGNTLLGSSEGVYLRFGSNNTVTGNTVQGNSTAIDLNGGTYATVSGNTIQGNVSYGISTTNYTSSTFSSNTIQGSAEGIALATSSKNNTITSNTVTGNTYGIALATSSNNNTISSNKLFDNGGATTNNSIYLLSSSYNAITDNDITDTACTTNCYSINVSDSGSNKNYLANNHYSGSAANAATIHDVGTNTVYSNQQTNSTTSTNSDVTDFTTRGSANSATAFQVQNASGASIFNIDTTNSLVGTAATSIASTNSQDFNLRTGNATGATSNSGSLKLDVGTATGTAGSILIGTVNAASAITIGSASQAGAITLGQSTASNTITIGSVIGAGNTQTINIGTSATGATNVTIGSASAGATTINAGADGISLVANTTLANGKTLTLNNNSAAGLQVSDSSSSKSVLTIDTSGDQVLLGKAGASGLTGKLTFYDSAGTHTAAISGPSSDPATSFVLTLPSALPGTTQCLQSDNTGSLSFTSCVSGTVIASIGAYSSSNHYTDGATISGTALILGSADPTHPGLVDSSAQSFDGNKTFTGTLTVAPSTNIGSTVIKQTSAASPTNDIFDVVGANGTSSFIQVTSTAANQGAVNIQSLGGSNGLTLQSASGTVSLGSSTGLNASAGLTISSGGTSDLTLNSLSGTLKLGANTAGILFTDAATASIDAASGQELDLGAANNGHATRLGSANAGAATTIQGGGGISLSNNTTVAGGQTFTVTSGLTSLTGAASGDALSVSNSTSTGNIAVFKDGSTAVLTIADGGVTTFENQTNSAVGFQIQNNGGSDLLNVNTIDGYVINNGTAALGNELVNPSFEASGTTDGSGWYAPSATQVITNDSANARSGNKELQVTANSTAHTVYTKYFAVHPGDTVYAEAYVKNSAGAAGDAGIFLEYSDKDKATTTTTTADTGLPGTSYIKKSIADTVPAGKYFARLAMSVKATATAGTFYFDDAYLKLVNQQAPLLITNTSATAFQVQNSSSQTVLGVDASASTIFSTIADGASAVGFNFKTAALSTAGAKVLSLKNNTTEEFYIDKDGNVVMGAKLDTIGANALTIGGTTATGVTLGSTTAASGSQTFNVGNNATAGTYVSTVNVGSGLNASTTTIKSGTGGINLTPSGGSNTGVLVKPVNGSTAGFQVQNSSTQAILGVDTASSQVILGMGGASGLNGKLLFSTTNAANTTITIQAASTAASYSLTLPTAAPALGQCLQNDATTLGQLTFGPCGATGTFLSKNVQDTSTFTGLANGAYGYTFTNGTTGPATSSGVLSLDNGGNTGTVLNVKGSSTTAFQVQSSGSAQVLTVDTTNKKVILGQASSANGSLVFQNSASANAITLNSTASSSNYTLTLPSTAPAGGLCIETSSGNSSQLVFASCSNNNASIQEVNEWDANNTNSVTVAPTTIGDEMVLTTQIPTSGVTVTNVSGGGVTTWSKVVTSAGNGTVNRVELWVGTVTATGSSPITVTYTSSPGAEEITATEFTAAGVNASTSWGIESSNSQLNSSASSTVTFPTATAVNGSELYIGYAQVQNPPATAGSSSGFNYMVTSTQHNIISYDTSLVANATYQPTATQNSSGQSNSVDVVLTAFVTSTSINNTTSLQKANFFVQAASGGTVAGVLQAASSGSSDIMDLRNSGGTNVFSASSTGNILIKPSASATAFQVQNGSNFSVVAVDTAGNQLVLGDATHLSGKITFSDSTDSNTISIFAPSSVAASYNLALPTNTPTAGLCLGTSPSNANQLIFASCATQVSAASITYINQWSNNGTSVTTLADAPASIGNLLVMYSHATNNVSISSVSGGGVTNWTKVTGNTNAGGQGNNEMWRGVVTSAGSSTITVNYSAAAGVNEIVAQEYTMGGTGGGTWAIDTSGTAINSGSQSTINYPSLTPANSSELYAGYAWTQNTMSAGSTGGYTYTATAGSKFTVRDTSVTGGVTQQPTATQSLAGNYNSIAALIQAFAGTSVIVNSTATQQANFNVQAAISGTVAGVLQGASSGSADVLQVKDGTGANVMTVSASSGISLSTSNTTGGQLNFIASGNGNIISILTPNTPGSSYSLTLPTTTPAPGQCLATSPSNANQLVFSSCANQVTSVAISFVNSWKTSTGVSPATLSVSPANVGDLLVLFVSFQKANSVSGAVTGGGCSAWSKVASTGSGSGTDTTSMEMYRCQVATAGASTISVPWSGPAGTHELAAMEFTTGSTTGSWVVDSSNTQFNTSSATTTWPSLTPQSSKDLYVGYGSSAGSTYTGTVTSGFTGVSGSLTNREGLYNTSVSTTTAPTAATSGSAVSLTVGALIAAYSSSSVISNSTVTQEGNFNIQASTSGSVAGILQAFGAGTGDIMDLLDGSGTLVGSFGYSGNMLVKPSTVSAAAFQVQTTGGVNVLSADTSAKQVVVGAGAAGETSVSLLVLDNQTGSSADPATAVNGAMYYNATTHTFRCGVAGAWQNCSGMLYANTSKSSDNSNCSNNCAAFSTAASVPANYCQAGRVINLLANGYFSSQASTTNLQFGVYYGADASVAANDVLLGTLPPTASVTSASNNYFQIDFSVICFSTTSMMAQGVLNLQIGAAGSGLTPLQMSSTSPTTVVSSSAKNLYIFPIWSAASASDTATITQFSVASP